MTDEQRDETDHRDDGDDGPDRHDDDPDRHDDFDDLEGFQTSSGRFVRRARGWIAALVTLALLASAGGWVLSEYAFSAAGDAVEEQLGGDAELTDALLLVRSTDCLGRRTSGSAFVLELDGRPVVVTNRHVVDGARTIGVRPLSGGNALRIEAHGFARDVDVAVLQLANPDAVPAALVAGADPAVGESVRIVGFPSAMPATHAGVVDEAGGGRLLLDLVVDPGASGSPVLDDAGRVVGQVFGRMDDGRGVANSLSALVHGVRTAEPGPDCPA